MIRPLFCTSTADPCRCALPINDAVGERSGARTQYARRNVAADCNSRLRTSKPPSCCYIKILQQIKIPQPSALI
uniref:Uncharacterized protein n=2 Tax=Setaria TaxID=4554 RepID=K3XNZ5_SETIT|nr:hypothetical protein SEVIR_5G120450v2 [Setaria viridis]